MKLVINGTEKDVAGDPTLIGLIEQLKFDPKTLVVEHNGIVLRREQFEGTSLSEGDRIELVRFVGGG